MDTLFYMEEPTIEELTAKEMFKELDYKVEFSCDYSIKYVKKIKIDYIPNTKRTIEKHIDFQWDDNEGVRVYEIVVDKQFPKTTKTIDKAFLDQFEIKAISKQMEELGW